jgi:hypothetical protein
MDLRLLLIFAGAFAAIWAGLHWRAALQAVMVLLVVEGAIRKWLFPGAQDLVYLAKDVLLVGIYVGYLRSPARLRYRPPKIPALYTALTLGAIFCLFQIFNPQLPNLLVGAFGFKAYFLYVPLLFVVPAAFPTDRDLVVFLRRYILLSIPVGALAVAQFLSPSSSRLNTYAWGAAGPAGADVSTFGASEFVRVTATFSYISGYGSYLIAMSILILSYLAAARWRLQRSLLVYAALGMALLGMLMTGSRGPVLMLALLFPIYWWLAVIRGGQGGGATFARLLFGMTLIGILLGSAGAEAVAAFRGRAAGSGGDVRTRIIAPFTAPFHFLPEVGVIGYGIGATHQAAAAVATGVVPYSWLRGLAAEVESARVMIELGPVGFLLVYFSRIYLIIFAFRQVLVMRTGFHRALATACLLFFLAQLPGNIIFDLTSDLYFWFFSGLLLLVMRFDRVAVAKAARAAAAPPAAPAQPPPRLTPVPTAASPAPDWDLPRSGQGAGFPVTP